MNAFSKIDMGEVTRLTQAGKLAEAMALLQGHIAASSIAGGSPGSRCPSIDPGDPSARRQRCQRSTWSPRRLQAAAWAAPTRQFKQRAAGESRTARQGRGAARSRADDAGVSWATQVVGALSSVGDGLGTARRGAGPHVPDGAPIRGAHLLERRRKFGPTRCTCPAAIRASPSRSWSCCTAALQKTQTISPRARG